MKIKKRTYFLAAALSAMLIGGSLPGRCADSSACAPGQNMVNKTPSIGVAVEKDFKSAYDAAKKEGKKLVLEFSGSDWCPPCQMMHKFVINTEKFAKYADKKLKMLVIDFDRQGNPKDSANAEQFTALAKKYNLRYFPTIVVIDPSNDSELVIEGMVDSPEELISKIESAPTK